MFMVSNPRLNRAWFRVIEEVYTCGFRQNNYKGKIKVNSSTGQIPWAEPTKTKS